MLELVLVLEAVLELVLVLVDLASTQVASWHLDVSLMYLGFSQFGQFGPAFLIRPYMFLHIQWRKHKITHRIRVKRTFEDVEVNAL